MANNSSVVGPMNPYETFRIAAPGLLVADRTITPIFYLIGAIGNPLSAKIWLSTKVRKNNSSAIYLGAIAIVDCIFLFLHVWMELLQAWGVKTFNRPILCPMYNVLLMIPQYLAPMLILGFTFERFIAICFPFFKESYCTVRKAIIGVCVLTSVAMGFGLVQAYFWTYFHGMCMLRESTTDFLKIWNWFSEMLIFLAVPLFVLIFNILVIVEINKINKFNSPMRPDGGRSSHQTSTITLLSVSFYLICTLLPATIVYTLQMIIEEGNFTTPPSEWSNDPTWNGYLTYYHIRRIVEEICLSNFACYVFIYYITSAYFRKEVRHLWCFRKCNCCQDDLEKKENVNNVTNMTIVNMDGKTVLAEKK